MSHPCLPTDFIITMKYADLERLYDRVASAHLGPTLR
jgi:hypothetical protein